MSENETRYYTDIGEAHDSLLRCKDCQKLVTFEAIKKLGMCDGCGNKRFSEIVLLTEEEMDSIMNGTITFPNSDKFLMEFSGVEL